MQAADLHERGLAVKYCYTWLQKVFPGGTAAQRHALERGDPAPSPVHWVVYRHDQGAAVFTSRDGQHLPLLQPGAPVFEVMKSTFGEPMHPAVPRDMRYLMGRNQDWSNNLHDYISIVFSRPCVPYLLINTLSQEPKWLREKFYKLRDPNYAEVHLRINWKLHLGGKLMFLMMGKLSEWRRSTMRVFRSKRVYQAGDTLVLGGPGLANMTDMLYAVAFQNATKHQIQSHRVAQREAQAAAAATLRGDLFCENLKFVIGTSGQETPTAQDEENLLDGGKPIKASAFSSGPGADDPSSDGLQQASDGVGKQAQDGVGTGSLLAPDTSRRGGSNFKGARFGGLEGVDSEHAPQGGQKSEGGEVVPVYVEGGCVFSYHEAWMPKFIKSIRRGRLGDVRKMVKTDLELPADISYLASHDITFLPPGDYSEVLTVDLAVRNGQLEMLCILVARCRCALSYPSLAFLVHHWESVPSAYGSAEQLIMDYACSQPGPLAVVSAAMRAMRAEIKRRYKKQPTGDLEEALDKLQALQLLILDELREIQRHAGGDEEQMPRLRAVLDPPPTGLSPMLISELPPLRMALEDQDTAFMDASLVQIYMSKLWEGPEFVLETCKDGSNLLTILDPSFTFSTLVNLGFASRDMTTLNHACRLYHYITWGQQAFFNSPRARWAMDVLGSLFYFITFLQIVGAGIIPDWKTVEYHVPVEDPSVAATTADPYAQGTGQDLPVQLDISPEWRVQQTINSAVFSMFTIGNVVEALIVLLFRYRRDALKYASRNPSTVLFLAVDILLLYLTITYAMRLNHTNYGDSFSDELFEKMQMVWAAMAPFVCGRLLGVIIPMVSSLGPMLNTMMGMLAELLIFMLPWTFITIGFAIALKVIYGPYAEFFETLSPFHSFWTTMFFLLQAFTDKFDYTMFDDLPSEALRTYGKVIYMLYTISNGLLLGNLLIAIITNRYKPEKVRQQASLNMAEIIDYHKFQVDTCWLSSPWCLIQAAFFWLPRGTRPKVHMFFWYSWSLPFLDGFTAASGAYFPRLPTGRDEIPHLIYLLTIHPLIFSLWFVAFAVHTPLCILYFTFKGNEKAMKECKAMVGSGSMGSSRVFEAAEALGQMSMMSSGTMNSNRRSSFLSTSGASPNDDIAFLNQGSGGSGNWSAGMSTWQAWKTGAWRVLYTIGCCILGTFTFILLHLVGQTAWALMAWLSAITWALINIARGALEPCLGLFARKQQRQHGGLEADLTTKQSEPGVSWLRSEASMQFQSGASTAALLAPSRGSTIRSNRVAPERAGGSVSSVSSKRAATKSVAGHLKLLLQEARDLHKSNPSYIEPETLQRLITHVFKDKVRFASKEETKTKPTPVLPRTLPQQSSMSVAGAAPVPVRDSSSSIGGASSKPTDMPPLRSRLSTVANARPRERVPGDSNGSLLTENGAEDRTSSKHEVYLPDPRVPAATDGNGNQGAGGAIARAWEADEPSRQAAPDAAAMESLSQRMASLESAMLAMVQQLSRMAPHQTPPLEKQ